MFTRKPWRSPLLTDGVGVGYFFEGEVIAPRGAEIIGRGEKRQISRKRPINGIRFFIRDAFEGDGV